MSNHNKKVEVRFGTFSCAIEGYDDPVSQMREILGMMQKMIAETPSLAETQTDLDAERISDALDGASESTPGVVVIRNAETGTDPGPATEAEEVADDVPDAEGSPASDGPDPRTDRRLRGPNRC